MKFLDKETGTLGERIRTLFKEQGITIVSILTALGMTLGVLIEALLGGPSTTPTSQSTTTSDKKGGAREWIKNKLKALSQLLGKLADKASASLPGIIGSILSWILNRTGRLLENTSEGIRLQITKKAESAGKLSCYLYIFQDAQINISDAQFLNVVY